MGGTHWGDLSGKKRWGKAHSEKKAELFSIAQKYHLTRDTKPEYIIDETYYYTFDSFEYDAKNYADSKYAHTAAVSGWGLKIAIVSLSIIFSVAAVLLTPFSGGSSLVTLVSTGAISTGLAALIVGSYALLSASLSLIVNDIYTKAQRNQIQAGIYEYRQSAKDFTSKEKSNTQSMLMIYGKYEIYANGSIYNSGRAGTSLGGDNTYSPSHAYDPTRGMRAELLEDKVDDCITYRAHTTLAGNRDFMQSMLGTSFPLANNAFNHNLIDETINKSLLTRLREINEGFSALIDACAGITYTHGIEKTSNPALHYEKITQSELGFFKNKLIINDFLQKQEHYKNGHWADLFFLYFKDSKQQKQSAMQNAIFMLDDWDSEQSIALRAQMSEFELVKCVIEIMIYSIEVILENFEGNVYNYDCNPAQLKVNTKTQNDNVLKYFTLENAKSAQDIQTLFNYIIAWLDKDALRFEFDTNTYDIRLTPPFSKEELMDFSTQSITYNWLKYSLLDIVKKNEKTYNCRILYFPPPDLQVIFFTDVHGSPYNATFFTALDTSGVSDEFIRSLCKYKWSESLNNVDLSKYSLIDLGLI